MNLSRVAHKIEIEARHFSRVVTAGYMGAWFFTNLNPMVGGIYGASLYVTVKVTEPMCQKKKLSKANQLLTLALRVAVSTLVVMKAMGLPLNATTAMKMIGSFFLGAFTLKLGVDFIARQCGLIKLTPKQQVSKKQETESESEGTDSSSASSDVELASSTTPNAL